MKTVAVSQRVDNYPDRSERRDALDQRLIALMLAIKCLPVPIPNGFQLNLNSKTAITEDFHKWIKAIQPEAFLLSGGNDVGNVPERDLVEGLVLEYAEKRKLPVLGVCRGMQFMGVMTGGKLAAVKSHVGRHHYVSGEITGKVNSYHTKGFTQCPPKFRILARSEDGCIEAFRHENLPWEGWMWHPEREPQFDSRDIKRLKALFS